MESPNNCWPSNLARFSDALANSAQFQTLVGTPAIAELAAGRIFGKRLTNTKDGRVWTAEDRAVLSALGMVYSDPANPFGYHLTAFNKYLPHGSVVMVLERNVPDARRPTYDAEKEISGLTDEHDREWENIVGTIIKQILTNLREEGGPTVPQIDITTDYNTPVADIKNWGCWQGSEVVFAYREE